MVRKVGRSMLSAEPKGTRAGVSERRQGLTQGSGVLTRRSKGRDHHADSGILDKNCDTEKNPASKMDVMTAFRQVGVASF